MSEGISEIGASRALRGTLGDDQDDLISALDRMDGTRWSAVSPLNCILAEVVGPFRPVYAGVHRVQFNPHKWKADLSEDMFMPR